MDDYQIIAASALCVLSLLNYRNVLRRQSIEATMSPRLQSKSPQRLVQSPYSAASLAVEASEKIEKKCIIKKAVKKKKLKIVGLKSVDANKKRRRQRRCWMKPIHSDRTIYSMDKLFEELTCEDSGEYMKLFRMSRNDFYLLLAAIEPAITKKTSHMRKPIPAKIRLAVTLRYLATGENYRSLHNLFKVSSSAITLIIPEVCEAINNALKDEIKLPETPDEWMTIEEQFKTKFPRCVGVVTWRRIISQSNKGGQRTHCFVLLAVVDCDYRFIFAETTRENGLLWQKLQSNSLDLPPDSPLPGRKMSVPYIFLGDQTFALHKHVMVPFANNDVGTIEGTFNYHLSSARLIADNAFGVLTSVFRIFKKPIDIEKGRVSLITMTCVLLHNFLRRSLTSRNIYTPPGTFDSFDNGDFVEGSWRRNIEIGAVRSMPQDNSMPSPVALKVRSEYAEYLDSSQF